MIGVSPALKAPSPTPPPVGGGEISKRGTVTVPLQAVSFDNLSFGNSTQPPPFSRIGGKAGIGGEQDRVIQ